MKKLQFLTIFLFLFTFRLAAQAPQEYARLIGKADSLLQASQYANASTTYSQAFKSFGWTGYKDHRYNAARAWAMANIPDSAFFNLFSIVEKLRYSNLQQLEAEQDFQPIRQHPRWPELIAKVKTNMLLPSEGKENIKAYKPLLPEIAALLDSIFVTDQQYRNMTSVTESKYGRESKEMQELWQKIGFQDSINTLHVSRILDTKGWLSPKEVGERGASALFLVVQHANLTVQQKYLPVLREAVKTGKAKGGNLALLEDRVALREGRKQIYGSQISRDRETGVFKISPIEDPLHVDERRKSVGLSPLKEYVMHCGLTWDEAAAQKMMAENLQQNKH